MYNFSSWAIKLRLNVTNKGGCMDNKKPVEDETGKLIYVVICMSMIVLVLFGLGPSI
jgi:hypothetical protein